ncbi:hypothetical protein G3N59_10550 [Paraburkholderia sp. Ac-20340]|uniref:hypothetical protein n=1 Tax=Paraburkholderia sp. Ac-20340 TaxID=2703888 RepID=UPI00197DC224|nr:hypothetical protein [Paraburkholderia sp. Ac-20340]MBN3853820.1 hypothetical protein [Paraburkholderia sp. Ac-20340]
MDKAAQRAQWLQEVSDAQRIGELLRDEAVRGAFAKLEEETIREWRDSEDYPKSIQSDAWHRLRALDDLKQKLQSIVTTGEIAAKSLEDLKRG